MTLWTCMQQQISSNTIWRYRPCILLCCSLPHILAVVNSFPLSVQGAHTSVLVSVHSCFLRGVGSVSCCCLELAALGHLHQVLSLEQECSFVWFSTCLLQKINTEVPYLITGFDLNFDTETLLPTHTKNLDLSNCCLFKSAIINNLSLGKTVRNCIRDFD